MTLIEVYSDPAGDYLGTVLVDPERLPLKRFCGLFWWWVAGDGFDESPIAGDPYTGGKPDDFYDGGERHTDVW